MSLARSCPECGAIRSDGSPEDWCERCLMNLGLSQEPMAETTTASDLRPALTRQTSKLGVKFHAFGDYELESELARGGMGIVFQAWQRSLQRHVALKFLLPDQLDSSERVRRFRTEAEANARLDHPNIVPIHEIGEVGGQHYLCMKLIRGRTLTHFLEHDRFSPGGAAEFMATLATAIYYAHQRGVLHRDLKPGNILVDEHGQPQVTDFGLARLLESPQELTRTGAVIGTPAYMSPEQAAGGARELTTASDIYSLGAIFYEMLVGRPPFRAGTAEETIRQVRECQAVPPRDLNPAIPRELNLICRKCLDHDPGGRYETALALAEDLRRFMRGDPVLARPVSPLIQILFWCQRHSGISLLLGLVFLLLVLFTGAALSERQRVKLDNLTFARLVARTLREGANSLGSLGATVQAEAQRLRTNWLADRSGGRPPDFMNYLKAVHGRSRLRTNHWATIQNWVIMDAEGNTLGRCPGIETGGTPLTNRIDRDYCIGAIKRFRDTGQATPYFSAVYDSKEDGLRKIGISVVLPDPDRQDKSLGVLTAMIYTTSEALAIHSGVPNHAVCLIARMDPSGLLHSVSNEDGKSSPTWVPYLNPRAQTAIPKAPFPSNWVERSTLTLFDPTGRVDPGLGWTPWSAGLAPVPDTPFVVLVRSRDWIIVFLVPGLCLTGITLALAGWRSWLVRRRVNTLPACRT